MRKKLLSLLVLLMVAATGAMAQTTYKVSVKEGTEDATSWQGKAGSGEYKALPLEGVAANTAVSVKYSGTKKVKSVKAVKKTQAAAYTMAAAATSADRGKLICADGHIHAYGEDADCTADRVAMITYVGSQTAETAYTHGLALALQDASEDMFTWSVSTASKHTFHPYPVQSGITTGPAESGLQYNATQNTASYPAFQAAIANNDVATPTDCSAWFLPSGYQWYQMFQALDSKTVEKGKNALRDSFESVGGANLKKGDYQTSTEYSKDDGVYCPFGSTVLFTSGSKTNGRYVRSCLAF